MKITGRITSVISDEHANGCPVVVWVENEAGAKQSVVMERENWNNFFDAHAPWNNEMVVTLSGDEYDATISCDDCEFCTRS